MWQPAIPHSSAQPTGRSIYIIIHRKTIYIYIYIYVIYWPSTEPSIKRCTCVSQLKIGCRSDSQLQIGGFGSLVTPGWANQAKMRKKYCYGRRRNWVNIAVRPCLHSFLSHNKHHLFENKVWEIYIFIRSEFVRYWSRHYRLMMFPHVSVYLCSFM